ncbi:MAG: SGNH/GDSL hydrolase family protein, partial [Halioglobus sp.]|nr:SGNH/GDSL hydrolase family protein [Halioglobus sp.]
FIGASTTYCAEVSGNDQVWTELVSRKLEEQLPGMEVDYINGGVPGYTTTQSMTNLRGRMLPLDPDVVVIYHATNDVANETRAIATQRGVKKANLATEESAMSRYSVLWLLVEKNLAIKGATNVEPSELIDIDTAQLGETFRDNLRTLVKDAYAGGVKLVALATFSTHVRPGMSPEQVDKAMESARYYMPYLAPETYMGAFSRYNDIIREVAAETGALLIDDAERIPGDPVHFNDSVHFTDAGSRVQSERVAESLMQSRAFLDLANSIVPALGAGKPGLAQHAAE